MRSTKPQVKRWKWGGAGSAWVVEGLRDQEGRRLRRFFPSRDAANAWLSGRRDELRDQGRGALTLTDAQRLDAVEALRILAPHGASLRTAAEQFAERSALLSRTVTFAALRTEVVIAKTTDRKSARYLSDLKNRLAVFGKEFDERPVATIETRELDDWLRGLKLAPTSRKNFRKVLHTAFEFAVARGYARENPVTRTAEVKATFGAPGILTPAEIGALLAKADRRIVPALAVSAFAGLRDAEVGRISWTQVDLQGGYIKVDATIAKTSSRRIVPITANLKAWLAPYAQTEGAIRPCASVSYPLYRAARAEAVKDLKSQKIPARNLVTWPHNALRHSFCSYRLAQTVNAAQVAEECGHSVQIMKQHYRELVTAKEALAWFSVMPAGQSPAATKRSAVAPKIETRANAAG